CGPLLGQARALVGICQVRGRPAKGRSLAAGRRRDRILAMDDLQRIPIVGTRDWKQHAVVLDVPKDSVVIRLGVLLVAKGKVWFDNLKLETVGRDVRVT